MSWVKIFYMAFDVSKDSGRVDLAILIKAGSSWLRCIKMTRGNISTEIILQFPLKSHQSNKDLEYCYSDIFISLIKLISNFGFCVVFFFFSKPTQGTTSLWDGIWGQVTKNITGGVSQGPLFQALCSTKEIKEWTGSPEHSSAVFVPLPRRGDEPSTTALNRKSVDLWIRSLWRPSSKGSLWVSTLKPMN